MKNIRITATTMFAIEMMKAALAHPRVLAELPGSDGIWRYADIDVGIYDPISRTTAYSILIEHNTVEGAIAASFSVEIKDGVPYCGTFTLINGGHYWELYGDLQDNKMVITEALAYRS